MNISSFFNEPYKKMHEGFTEVTRERIKQTTAWVIQRPKKYEKLISGRFQVAQFGHTPILTKPTTEIKRSLSFATRYKMPPKAATKTSLPEWEICKRLRSSGE